MALTVRTATANGLTLAGANTFTGPTTIVANGAATAIIVANPLALQNSTVITDLFNASGIGFNLNAAFNITSATLGGLAGFGNIALPGADFNLSIGNNNQNTTYSGQLTGGQASSDQLTKIGSGTLALGGINFYSGLVVVNNGTLQTIVPNALFGSSGAAGAVLNTPTFGTLVPGNSVYVNNSGVWDMYSLNQLALTLGGNGTVQTGGNPFAPCRSRARPPPATPFSPEASPAAAA